MKKNTLEVSSYFTSKEHDETIGKICEQACHGHGFVQLVLERKDYKNKEDVFV